MEVGQDRAGRSRPRDEGKAGHGDPQLDEADHAILRRITTGDLADEFDDALARDLIEDGLSAAAPLAQTSSARPYTYAERMGAGAIPIDFARANESVLTSLDWLRAGGPTTGSRLCSTSGPGRRPATWGPRRDQRRALRRASQAPPPDQHRWPNRLSREWHRLACSASGTGGERRQAPMALIHSTNSPASPGGFARSVCAAISS